MVAAALVGVSASAKTVYWDNTDTGWTEVIAYSWEPSVDETLSATTIDGHEVYAIELDNEEIIFKGSAAWSDTMQTANLPVTDGAVYGKASIKSNGGSIDPIATITNGVWSDYSAPVDKFPAMYLVGDMNGWSASAKYKMETTDGVTYTLSNQSFTTTDQFKFFGGNWGLRELTYTGGTVNVNTEYPLGSGSLNISVAEACSDVTVKLVVNSDYTSGTLTLVTEGGDDPVPPTPSDDYEGWYVNLGGDFITGYWRGMAVPTDGKVSFDGLAIGTDEFKLKVWNGTDDIYYTTAGHVVATDVATVMTESTEIDCAITITGATEGALYDVTFDCATNTITVVNHEGEIVMTYNIYGTITTGDAQDWVDLEMTEDAEGNWSWNGTVVPGSFGIRKMENGVQTAWYSSADADAATINGSGNYSVMVNGTNWTSELVGDAAFTFNPETLVLTASGSTAVETVEVAEAGEAVYFNLQGVRVENPANGLFVRVLNGKATKVVM